MSTEQPLDPQLVEQTKQQIRSLVAEIAELTKADIAPEQFYGEFLPRVVSALAAVGGAVWTVNSEGQLALQYQINLQEARLREQQSRLVQHDRLLYKVLSGGESILVPPHSGPTDSQDDQAANPTEFLLLFGLLKTDLETVGIVEVFQRAEAAASTQRGYLRFLMQMCELAGEFIKSHQLRHFSHRQVLWTQLEEFARVVHESLDPRSAAYTIANEGRRLIECDRVSVAIRKGNRCTIEAISGQDLFDKRSNTVRLLGKLATAVVATGDPMWYTGDTRDLPPQVEDALQEYIDDAHSKTVAVLPLRRPIGTEEDDPNKRPTPEPPVGALIVEQIEDSRVAASLMQRVDVVCRHSSTALANAREHQDLFLMPVWRMLGKSRWVLQARTLPKTLSILGAVVLLIAILCVWPAELRLESKGTLEPVQRQNIFARGDGTVEELCCKDNDKVAKDQLLIKLRSTELEVNIRQVEGDLVSSREQFAMVQRILHQGGLKNDEQLQRQGDQSVLIHKIKNLEAQLALQKSKQQDLEIRSPLNGIVVTSDVKIRLERRPVKCGQLLLAVADPDGPWQLELHMPDNRMGYINTAQDLLRKDLEVTYILATEPGKTRYGYVTEVHRSAEVRGEEGNTVLIKVAINKEDLPQLRPGATVTAKVDCGRRSLGFVLLHDVIEFIQSRILFKFF